jgi:hypothetical protein
VKELREAQLWYVQDGTRVGVRKTRQRRVDIAHQHIRRRRDDDGDRFDRL